MLKLYGSIPSPYVRRIRILLQHHPHEFVVTNVYDDHTRAELMRLNPTMKIPMLLDNDFPVFDSGVIFRYLREKFSWDSLDWEQENWVTLINAANDSLVQLFMLQRSGIITEHDALFVKLQNERLAIAFNALNQAVVDDKFTQWNYPSICLYCLLDWAIFRELYDFSKVTDLLEFHKSHQSKSDVVATDPRL